LGFPPRNCLNFCRNSRRFAGCLTTCVMPRSARSLIYCFLRRTRQMIGTSRKQGMDV
jgi:hypothetical protein